jgi:peptidoglycan/xylan/chitin deacetylase (PgdA/CDA1 family)
MIGVAVQSAEREAANEFFELCKTSWEYIQVGRTYEVVVSSSEMVPPDCTRFLMVYGGVTTRFDPEGSVGAKSRSEGGMLTFAGQPMPIYGNLGTFSANHTNFLRDSVNGDSAVHSTRHNGTIVARIGYNLFEEVRFLLTTGQPASNALIPTLELHIKLLRELVTRAGIPFVEIPAVPYGHAFTACLSHDIDHPVLRNHRFDRTMFGYLNRATFGSLLNTARGRRPISHLHRNWLAAARLPLVQLGLAKDSWSQFDRYLEIEAGLHSTFFVIPKRGYAGQTIDGKAPAARSCKYTLNELQPQLERIRAAGNEVGLHGIDAWLDADEAVDEQARVIEAHKVGEIGVRMHWLYFDRSSPAILDKSGFSYDSTVGYNGAVGFRSGTTQVYRPFGVVKLLEIPLHIMDTALFYPDYLNLGYKEATKIVDGLIDEVSTLGGVLTFNWHDRSIAPERCWDDFYEEILRKLLERRAWCPTMSNAVAWFRKRRSSSLKFEHLNSSTIKVSGTMITTDELPDLIIRVHMPFLPPVPGLFAAREPAPFVDLRLINGAESKITISK